MRLRTVLVGAGKVGAGFADDPVMARHYRYASHAQVLAEHARIEWGAVVDVDPGVTERVRERWGVARAGRSVREACADGYAPELAIVATPPGERVKLLEELPGLRAVIVEKPLGTSEAEAQRFLDACRERNILVQVNLWRRADDGLRDLRARLEDLVGRPQTAFVVYGNGLHNNGTHMIDLVRMLLGEVRTVRTSPASLRPAHGPIPGDVHVEAHLGLTTGITVAIAGLDFREYRENAIEIWGTTGRVSIRQEGLLVEIAPRGENRAMSGEREVASDRAERLEPTCGMAFYRMYDNVLDALEGRAELVSTGDSALRTARVVDLVERSARADGAEIATGLA